VYIYNKKLCSILSAYLNSLLTSDMCIVQIKYELAACILVSVPTLPMVLLLPVTLNKSLQLGAAVVVSSLALAAVRDR